jgi:hypothetical protein
MRHQHPCAGANLLKTAVALAWVALFASLLFVLAGFGNGQFNPSGIFNSDVMFVPVFLRDVLARHTIDGWDLPTNPYLMPDMMLFGLSDLLISDIRWAAAAYALVQLLLLAVGMTLLQRSLFGTSKPAQLWLLYALTLYFLLVGTGRYDISFHAVISFAHFGVVAMMPFALWAFVNALASDRTPAQRRWSALALLLLTGVMALSDSLYTVQFVIPVLFASLAVLWVTRRNWQRLVWLNAGLLLSAALGQWARQAIVPARKLALYSRAINARDIVLSWDALVDWTADHVRSSPYLNGYWGLSVLALVVALVIARRRWLRDRDEKTVWVMLAAAVFLGAVGTSVGVAVLTGNFRDGVIARYMLAGMVLPLLAGWPFCLALLQVTVQPRTLVGAGIGLCLLPLALIGYVAWSNPLPDLAAIDDYQHPLVACLEREAAQRGLTRGLAEYWDATSTMALSEGRLTMLQVMQVNTSLVPYHWNNNRHWYDEPFDFVVMTPNPAMVTRLEPPVVAQKLGEPDASFRCEQSTVYVYDLPGDARTRNLFRGSYVLADLTPPGAEAEFYGYSLPSRIGGVAIGLSQGASDYWGNGEGDLVFIPFQDTWPSGNYDLEIHTYADSRNTGSWEVLHHVSGRTDRLTGGPLAEAGRQVVTGTFQLSGPSSGEIRVGYAGHGTLFVDKIRLKRAASSQAAMPTAGPTPPPGTGSLQLVYPAEGASLTDRNADFVWEWTGPPLSAGQAFEVRLWQPNDPFHYGAQDARLSPQLVRQVGNTYIVRLDLNGAYGWMQHGPGDYLWTVGIVAVEPAYEDLQIEAPPHVLHITP